MTLSLREATPTDVPAILSLVHGLAVYEKEPDAVDLDENDYRQYLFPDDGEPTAHCFVAEKDGEVIGIAIWYVTFSTWTGPGIWLEDLFVLEEHRGGGAGKALLTRLAQEVVRRGWKRLEWSVLRWNAPSIAFYEHIGATAQSEWMTYRLHGEALGTLAEG